MSVGIGGWLLTHLRGVLDSFAILVPSSGPLEPWFLTNASGSGHTLSSSRCLTQRKHGVALQGVSGSLVFFSLLSSLPETKPLLEG